MSNQIECHPENCSQCIIKTARNKNGHMWESTAKRWGLNRIYIPATYKNAWIGSGGHDGYYMAECPGGKRVRLDND